jgi:ribokinase
MTASVLVVGAVNVDILGRVNRLGRADEAVLLDQSVIAPGGHAGNCAVALARQSIEPRLLGSVGTDALGKFVVDSLHSRGVDVTFIQRSVANPTGVAFIPILPDGDRVLYVAPGANMALDDSAITDNSVGAAAGCEMVIVFDPPETMFQPLRDAMLGRQGVLAPGGLACSDSESLAPLLEAASYLITNRPESLA